MNSTMHLYVVDDNEDDRAVYSRLLGKSGSYDWQIAEYETGEEGISALADKVPDCILLDYSLPGSDGLSTLSTIKQDFPYLPVIMLTGQGSESIAVSSLKMGAFDYICKSDISPISLNRSIENAIKSARLRKKVAQQEAELANFARVLAHDLNQPANAISSMLKIMITEHQAVLPEAVNKMLLLVAESAQQMSDLVQALVSYTQLEQAKPEKALVNLSHCIEVVQHNLFSEISANNVVISYAELPKLYLIKPLAIQLLQILISNAVLYNREQPKISISADRVGDSWKISVKDNGLGIEDKYKEAIFEPLFRLHSDTEFKGTGLGLATAARIVAKHQGRITCQDNDWGGTTFVISIPYVDDIAQ